MPDKLEETSDLMSLYKQNYKLNVSEYKMEIEVINIAEQTTLLLLSEHDRLWKNQQWKQHINIVVKPNNSYLLASKNYTTKLNYSN